ncbi:hypothetical protein L1987_13475 [Smallanthus sonchifolius]|uniref:Uncharacterized protein n=1 Tax=Smallanthus sonchifolius TaxID=185202 RepID=A0ACB9JHH0_9ASTR|nr:hypothetical protein L1987_13475 [Smallanthus sonchifolius]
MARQRRTYFHHHHHSRQNQNSHQNHVSNSIHHSHGMLVDDNCSGKSHGGNWLYGSSPPPPATVPLPPTEAPHRPSSRPVQSCDGTLSKQISSNKRQKEAESHLPDLDSRDRISIAMEDIGTSQVWNMRYSVEVDDDLPWDVLLQNTFDSPLEFHIDTSIFESTFGENIAERPSMTAEADGGDLHSPWNFQMDMVTP